LDPELLARLQSLFAQPDAARARQAPIQVDPGQPSIGPARGPLWLQNALGTVREAVDPTRGRGIWGFGRQVVEEAQRRPLETLTPFGALEGHRAGTQMIEEGHPVMGTGLQFLSALDALGGLVGAGMVGRAGAQALRGMGEAGAMVNPVARRVGDHVRSLPGGEAITGRLPRPVLEGSEETIRLTHYGPRAKDLDVIDPARYGTGQAGEERARFAAYPEEAVKPSFWYGEGGRVEPRFRGQPSVDVDVPAASHLRDMDQIQDFYRAATESLQTEGLPAHGNQAKNRMEALMADAGWEGYGVGGVNVRFNPTPATERGRRHLSQVEAHYADPENKGSTFTLGGENVLGKDTYSVAAFPGDDKVVPGPLTPSVLREFEEEFAEALAEPGRGVGTWERAAESGDEVVLDVVDLVPGQGEAEHLSRVRGQDGYFHLGGGGYIPTPDRRAAESALRPGGQRASDPGAEDIAREAQAAVNRGTIEQGRAAGERSYLGGDVDPVTALQREAVTEDLASARGLGESGGVEAPTPPAGQVDTGMSGTWISPVRAFLETHPKIPAKTTGVRWQKLLRNAPQSKTEREWSGIDKWLESRRGESITRAEVEEFFEANRPRLTETVLGRRTSFKIGDRVGDLDGEIAERLPAGDYLVAYSDGTEQIVNEASLGSASEPKFAEYTLPGGEGDYKVIITRLEPRASGNQDPYQVVFNPEGVQTYKSPHWDEDNAMTHIRTETHRGADGGRYTMVNELQDDWAQAGRDRGFQTDQTLGYIVRNRHSGNYSDVHPSRESAEQYLAGLPENMHPVLEIVEQPAQQARGAVPDRPYKETAEWVGLGVHRAIQEALESGTDGVAMIRGEQAADMFDLRKHVERLEWDGHELVAHDLQGDEVLRETVRTPEELEQYIGKGPAERLTSREAQFETSAPDVREYIEGYGNGKGLTSEQEEILDYIADEMESSGKTWDRVISGSNFTDEEMGFLVDVAYDVKSSRRVIEGEDLAVGGEGMTAFYDELVPGVMRAQAKRLGLTVEDVPIGITELDARDGIQYELQGDVYRVREHGIILGTGRTMEEAKARAVVTLGEEAAINTHPVIRITPADRERLQREGLRLGAALPEAVAGAAAAGGAAVGIPLLLQRLREREDEAPAQRPPPDLSFLRR
jgi:hypothetical protein